VALLLRKQGITRIRPLLGGLDAWRNLGYQMQLHEVEATAASLVTPTIASK
jgi:3-mercaptopyruvate sulfurtransferase SseA